MLVPGKRTANAGAMLVNSVHYTFASEDAGKAASIFRELRDASRMEEGVISFEVGRGQDDPNVFALWEEYRDKAALDAHLASDHFKRLVINGVRLLAKRRDFAMVAPL
ncbi:MAG TPA: putative quinol monooxygenase [Candidatus Rubrimentiphilum sp.]|nr:putative quinol monooxygenase [Candidatus Rubrimentiphilum sp.]